MLPFIAVGKNRIVILLSKLKETMPRKIST